VAGGGDDGDVSAAAAVTPSPAERGGAGRGGRSSESDQLLASSAMQGGAGGGGGECGRGRRRRRRVGRRAGYAITRRARRRRPKRRDVQLVVGLAARPFFQRPPSRAPCTTRGTRACGGWGRRPPPLEALPPRLPPTWPWAVDVHAWDARPHTGATGGRGSGSGGGGGGGDGSGGGGGDSSGDCRPRGGGAWASSVCRLAQLPPRMRDRRCSRGCAGTPAAAAGQSPFPSRPPRL